MEGKGGRVRGREKEERRVRDWKGNEGERGKEG